MRIATRIACVAAAAWLGLAVAATAAGAAEIVLVTTDAVKAILNGLVPARTGSSAPSPRSLRGEGRGEGTPPPNAS